MGRGKDFGFVVMGRAGRLRLWKGLMGSGFVKGERMLRLWLSAHRRACDIDL